MALWVLLLTATRQPEAPERRAAARWASTVQPRVWLLPLPGGPWIRSTGKPA